MENPLLQLFQATEIKSKSLKWPNESADRAYTIFFTGRCGSTELVDILSQTELCGLPDEYFNEELIPNHMLELKCQGIDEYIAKLVEQRSKGRIFGFKIDGFRHQQLCQIVDLNFYFPASATKFFYLTRRNIVEQAYSFAHAKASGVWHILPDGQKLEGISKIQPIELSDKSLWKEIALILEQEFYFERYFFENTLSLYRLDYEMLCASKASVISDVMLTIGCAPPQISQSFAAIKENIRKLPYDIAKLSRLIDFQIRFKAPISYLGAYRGRVPFRSVRNYLFSSTGIDIASE